MLGVIGWPIDHSLSPLMQNAALAALKKDAVYCAFPVAKDRLREAILGASSLGFLGLNLTIPHKQQALTWCRPDAISLRARAVNTLRFVSSTTILGTNTDIDGFAYLCAEENIRLGEDTRAIILGSGGAARAIMVVLADAQTPFRIFARKPQSLWLDGVKQPVQPLTRMNLKDVLPSCDVLIDCTPRGLLQGEPNLPLQQQFASHYPELDLALLPSHAHVVDLAVKSSTLLTQMASLHGLKAHAGHKMLVGQGKKALEFWFQENIDNSILTIMETAILP